MNDNYKKTVELIKKHLGVATPNWVIENVVELLVEFRNKEENSVEQFTPNEMWLFREWFHAVKDVNPLYMEQKDVDLYEKVNAKLL